VFKGPAQHTGWLRLNNGRSLSEASRRNNVEELDVGTGGLKTEPSDSGIERAIRISKETPY